MSPPLEDILFGVELVVTADDSPVIEELMAALGFDATVWVDAESNQATVRTFAASEAETAGIVHSIQTALPNWLELLSGAPPAVGTIRLKRQDWAECWKEHFHAFRASKRLVIKPSWAPYQPGKGDLVVELDPGMCFGTGYHGTTRACLEFLDDLATELGPVSFLDAGCGSGILSVAAARLGFDPITAFDHDSDAVRMTLENLHRAGIRRAEVACQDISAFRPPTPFRVVAANILARVLIACAEEITRLVVPDTGVLILSGILANEYGNVRERYRQFGCLELRNKRIEDWMTGCFQCGSTGPPASQS